MKPVQLTLTHIFIGPTLTAAAIELSQIDYQLHPPASHDSISRLLLEQGKPGRLVLVDGRVDEQTAVSHRELLAAIKQGWEVWGLADMGAIRAFELRDHGMFGFGKVYQKLQDDPELTDADILWHCTQSPDYSLLAEPAIHWQAVLSDLLNSTQITLASYQALRAEIQQTYYKKLSINFMSALFAQHIPHVNIHEIKQCLSANRTKVSDLDNFLHERPWIKQAREYLDIATQNRSVKSTA